MEWPFVRRATYDSACDACRDHNLRANRAEVAREQEHEKYEVADKAFSEMCAAFNRQSDAMDRERVRYAELFARFDALVQQIVDLKHAGFVAPPKTVTPARQNPTPSDDAIQEKAGTNPALRRHLIAWQRQQRALKIDEEEIADRILNWRDPSDNGEEAEAL